MYNSTLQSNTASTYGGAIYASSSTLNMYNSTLQSNTAPNNGGAIYASSSSTLNVYDSTLQSNTASHNSGGAIYAYSSSTLNMYNSTLQSNTASNNGGAICASSSTLNMYNSTLQSNTASNSGGAIYVGGGSVNLLRDTTFVGNEASRGSVLYAAYASSVLWAVDQVRCDTNDTMAVYVHAEAKVTGTCSDGKAALPFSAISLPIGNSRCPSSSFVFCAPCKVGRFRSISKHLNSSCTVCPAGRYGVDSAAKSSAAVECSSTCPPGKYSSSGECFECAVGRFGAVGGRDGGCPWCQSGQHTAGKVGQTNCISCAQSCVACVPGTCTPCAAGRHLPGYAAFGPAECTACPTGYAQESTAQVACGECTAGKFADTQGLVACQLCPAGKFSVTTKSASCSLCHSGRYGPTAGSGSESDCVNCLAGTYQSKAGQTSCLQCPDGQFISTDQATSCLQCSNSSGSECEAGQFDTCGRKISKWASVGNCLSCAPGKYLNRRGCEVCPQNYFSTSSSSKLAGCTECPRGKWQPATDSSFCNPPSSNSQFKPVTNRAGTSGKEGVIVMETWECPVGIKCPNGTMRVYQGDVWHDPQNQYPSQANMFTCVNDGCPLAGANKMECQPGYKPDSPLCAVCADGYYLQLRTCEKCEQPRMGAFIAFVVVLTLVLTGVVYTLHKHRHFASNGTMAHVKILVSFFTLLATVDVQFGITWPRSFLRALAVFSTFAFDMSVLSGIFCLFKVSFFTNLIFSTAPLPLVLAVLWAISHTRPEVTGSCVKIGVYLLLFAFPVVSTKIVEVFACHDIDGTFYLRADYSLTCYDTQWNMMVAYAAVFLIFYVIGWPLFVIGSLLRDSPKLMQRKRAPTKGMLLGFLTDDYKTMMPCLLWDGQEMVRKLLCSVVGAFWSDKSVMAIATALLLSIFFMSIHLAYYPFRSTTCNCVQLCGLSVLCLVYFSGLLLKVDAVETADRDALGVLLVIVVIVEFVVVLAAIGLEVRALTEALKRARRCGEILRRLPLADPDDEAEFYLIQSPVETDNTGSSFTPKQPEDLSHIPAEDKLAVLRKLTTENERRLEAFFSRLGASWNSPLQRVRSSVEVDDYGKVSVKHNRKSDESTLAKASRPAILHVHPRFSIEHVRDTFRFKAVVHSFRDALHVIFAMDNDKDLCPSGLSSACVAKLDIAKLREPKEWGWRFIAFDFIMPNKQLVEMYIVFTQMESAKKTKEPSAKVCPELSCHEIFEKWRVVDTTGLFGARLAEYEADRVESKRRYDTAFQAVLSHSSDAELAAFWDAFGVEATRIRGASTVFSVNPMSSAFVKGSVLAPSEQQEEQLIDEEYEKGCEGDIREVAEI